MFLVSDILIVEAIGPDPLLSMRRAKQGHKISLEVGAEARDIFLRVLADDVHLSDV